VNINATLIGQMITFALFVWFTMKYVWPPILAAMEAREKEIADGLAAAEQGAQAQEKAEAEATALLREAKQQAAEIIQNAEKDANQKVEESVSTAKLAGERQLEKAQADIEREVASAKDGLRTQVSSLAAVGASRILGKEVDEKTHAKLLDDLISQL
jgi:F-type H+-transporting ATPase subunit b